MSDAWPAWRLPVPGLAAHRGGLAEGPENTLFAMARGLAAGATHLEIDVRATKDGHAVCMHDPTAERTCLDLARIADLTLKEVRALDPCSLWSGLAGIATGEVDPPSNHTRDWFAVPTLDDVLRHFPGVPLMIDLKEDAPADMVAKAIKGWGRGSDVLLQGYDDEVLAEAGKRLPKVPRGAGLAGTRAFFEGEDVDAAAIVVPREHEGIELVDVDFVRAAHDQGKAFWVWTINEVGVADELLALGVDGLITDRPTKLAAVRRRRIESA